MHPRVCTASTLHLTACVFIKYDPDRHSMWFKVLSNLVSFNATLNRGAPIAACYDRRFDRKSDFTLILKLLPFFFGFLIEVNMAIPAPAALMARNRHHVELASLQQASRFSCFEGLVFARHTLVFRTQTLGAHS